MEVTLRCIVMALPVVELEPVLSLCESAEALKIAYTIQQGSPDHFDLTFSQSAKDIGFRDSMNAVMPNSQVIEIPLPSPLPLGKHNFTISFFAENASSNECKRSAPVKMDFSIDLDGFVHQKDEEVAFVDNSGKHNEDGLTFVSYQWYRNNELLEGETGQFYYEYNGLNGLYQVVMTGADGKEYRSCVYEYRPQTPVEEVEAEGARRGRKILRDGRLLIIVGDKVYNMLGKEEK